MGYEGMRWFKCDLQVQTPEDARHWDPADPLRLSSPRNVEELQDKARQYLRRCHEEELDVIGVTDHNFCSHRVDRHRFLAHLIEQNKTVAEELGRQPLWIFPGFEVGIPYHALCLFNPVAKGAHLDQICDILTELGLRLDSRVGKDGYEDLRRDGRHVSLVELLRIVQTEHCGIVIAAHAFQKDGIAKDDMHADDFRTPDLLAAEVSRFPLGTGTREQAVLEATVGKWSRPRPIAYIQSSDAKSTLKTDDGKPGPNALGYRWTWIKMSKPSIESLRQAFLDPKSRIRQKEQDPRIIRHHWIGSLSVRGTAFLADQEVYFSPNLNCIIGGRGSGKSSLFEYLRLLTRREDDPGAEEKVRRVRSTLLPASKVQLRWRGEDIATEVPLEDIFEIQVSSPKARISSRDVADPATVFRNLDLQIFSQGQISKLTEEPEFLLPLIDRLVGERLRVLGRKEGELRDRLRGLLQQRRTLERMVAEQISLEQEVAELDRRWQVRASIQTEQRQHRFAQEASKYLEDLAAQTEGIVSAFRQKAEDLMEGHAVLGSSARSWPESSYFEGLNRGVEQAKRELADRITQALNQYDADFARLTHQSTRWRVVENAIRSAEAEFIAACDRQGLAPQDLEQLLQLDRERKLKSFDLERKTVQVRDARNAVEDLDAALSGLHQIWRDQTRIRQDEVGAILKGIETPTTGAGRPLLEVVVYYCDDFQHFRREWSELVPDGRSRLGRQWEELGQTGFDSFRSQRDVVASPWQVFEVWRNGAGLPAGFADLTEPFRDYLNQVRDRWEEKILTRVRDSVDLILFRTDGSEVGALSQKRLSDGQRNTAVLTLLLAKGNGPILIDQPEDELDSNFLFKHLVPLLRRIKSERQVILVTHNPNLPVNADAELVYALSADAEEGGDVRGVVRAQGGLDQEAVKEAVLDIMEGSERAFRQRREKYHF